MGLKTYVINLEKSTVRRKHMVDQLAPYPFLDVEFLKAIDGRLLTEEERHTRFDYVRSKKLYGRTLNAGEVGCALSHRKVYQTLLNGDQEYALVLEDDISIKRDLNTLDLSKVDKILRTKRPRVLMLSGDYCFYRKRPYIRIYSAVGAYAYLINRAAARLILNKIHPCCVADEWLYYKRKGLQLYAVYPYMIDANIHMDILSSDVKQDTWGIDRSQMAIKEIILGGFTGIIKKLFKRYDHFEYKVRVVGNKVVGRKKTRRETRRLKKQQQAKRFQP